MKTAERRMFAKTIVTSDAFLDMPASARCLYFLLGVQADDDGFVNKPKSIMRQSGSTDDDLKLLIAKSFLIPFESGVVVIKHWKVHNLIKKDRYKETNYLTERESLYLDKNGVYHSGANLEPQWNTSGSIMEPQDRLGKDSIGKSIERESSGDDSSPLPDADYESIRKLYNEICKHLPQCRMLSQARKKALGARIRSGYTEDTFREIFSRAEQSDFLRGKNDRNWTANFDWLIKDANAVKVLDGNYENKKTGVPKGATGELGDAELEAIQRVLRGD